MNNNNKNNNNEDDINYLYAIKNYGRADVVVLKQKILQNQLKQLS